MTARLLERGKTSGRADDNMETIIKRFKTYEEQTRPIVAYYAERELVRQVDASKTEVEVFAQVVSVIYMSYTLAIDT